MTMLSRKNSRNYFATYKPRLELLASQRIPSWNQIVAWLKELEILRRAGCADEKMRFSYG